MERKHRFSLNFTREFLNCRSISEADEKDDNEFLKEKLCASVRRIVPFQSDKFTLDRGMLIRLHVKILGLSLGYTQS